MTYEEIMELIYKRNLKREKQTLTDEEAKLYYGKECYNLLVKIFKFCKEADYVIYQHATDLESADNIMQRGFVVQSSKIDDISTDILESMPIGFEYDEDGVKSSIYDGGQCELRQNGIRDELSDTQHFFENINCNLDFGSLTDPNVNKSGSGATCIFVVPKTFYGSREYKQYGVIETHYDDWEDKEVPESYFERHIIPKQFCIGYLDVKSRRFIANPSFKLNYGETDEFALGTTTATERDFSIEFENSIRRSK